VFEAILVLALSLMPSLLSLWVMGKTKAQTRERLRAAMEATARREAQTSQMPPEQQYIEGIGYLIGDITCQYNARSAYIRCAVNPAGPCDGCPYYEQEEVS